MIQDLFPPEDTSPPLDEYGGEIFSGPSYFEVISRFGDLYVSYRKRFVMMMEGRQPFVPRKDGNYLPLSNRIICGHLNQKFAICVYAGPFTSKFLCFDVDNGDQETVAKIIETLDDIGFDREKIYVSTSGGKGYHVEIFFDGLMYTDKLKVIYDYVCDVNQLDKAKVEFRPTAGQSIKLPLSVHRKTGNVCWYLDRDTMEPIRTADYVMQIEQFAVEEANVLIKQIKYIPLARPNYEVGDDPAEEISEEEHAMICGDRYPDIKVSGERNKLMVQIAVHNRYRGLGRLACKEELVQWYRRQNKELIKESELAVMSDIDQMIRWAYSDKFQLVKRTNEIVFGPEDFRILAVQPIQSRRKIMFYVLLCMKKYGHATASAQLLSEIFGISRTGVIKALNKLQEGKWIASKRNRCVSKPEGVVRLPNTYFLGDGAVGWSKGIFFADLPGLDRRREQLVKSIRFKVNSVSIDPDIKMDAAGVRSAYMTVMTGAFDENDLKEMMTQKEYFELEEGKNG